MNSRSSDENPPSVSVIMPTFNRVALTVEAIDSVRKQDFDEWELLVVDDGSTDDTPEVLAALAPDSRIRYFRQENQGQSVARNLGLRHARGEWIAFLDSDDLWLPDKLSRQVAYLGEHPDVDVLYGPVELIGTDGEHIGDNFSIQPHSGVVWRELLKDNFISFSTAIVRATLIRSIGGLDDSVKRADDYDLWLRLSTKAIFQFMPGIVTRYRIGGGRISDNVAGRYESNRNSVERFLRENPQLLSRAEVNRIRARMYGRFARGFVARGHFARGMGHALTGIRHAPLLPAAWRTLAAVAVHPVRAYALGQSKR